MWDDLHDPRVAAALSKDIVSGAPAHGWLFVGPAGSGKRAAARAMAAALNCLEQPGVGCGRCSVCQRVLRGSFPDVHHIVPEGTFIRVEVIREQVIPEAARSPFEGRFKVFVIEEAERMNPASQNALLKTLEEPPGDTLFILISDAEDELLETVRSRCRTVRFDPVPEDTVVALLVAEGAPAAAAAAAARLAGGDVERARSFAPGGPGAERREAWLSLPARLTSAAAALDLAAEVLETVKEALKTREKEQVAEATELAETIGGGRGTSGMRTALAGRFKRELKRLEAEILSEALAVLGSFYRDIVAARAGSADSLVNADIADEMGVWAGSDVGSGALLAVVESCTVAQGSLTKNANPTLVLESVFLQAVTSIMPPLELLSSR